MIGEELPGSFTFKDNSMSETSIQFDSSPAVPSAKNILPTGKFQITNANGNRNCEYMIGGKVFLSAKEKEKKIQGQTQVIVVVLEKDAWRWRKQAVDNHILMPP